MKNVHLLPTEKPSVLYKRNDLNTFHLGNFDICEPNDRLRTNQHIYITSYEEIKDGDWCLDLDTSKVFKLGNWHTNRAKKIILTTDLTLISDGVQAISDDFLEWFVKNPNCEFVQSSDSSKDGFYSSSFIPQEEPKQETVDEILNKKLAFIHDSMRNADFDLGFITGGIIGAEWQSEQIPSIIEQYLETAFISKEQGYMNPKEWFEQFKKNKNGK